MLRSFDCVTVSGTELVEIWKEVNYAAGTRNLDHPSFIPVIEDDINRYNHWVSSNKYVPFHKWLVWKIKIGTDNYGNLPENKVYKNKIGHCWAPCPYSIQSDDIRTRIMLGIDELDPLPVKNDHTIEGKAYYLISTSRGSVWGFECQYPGCTYYTLYGKKYFYK